MGDLKEKPRIKGLKKLLPYRNYTTEQETCPVDDQGFISYISSSFLNGLVFKSYRRPEDVKISWKCPKLETANYNLKRFHSLWHNEVKRKGDDASLVNVFFNMVRVQFILALFASIIYQAACFIGPAYVVRRILEHKAEAGTSDWRTGLYLSLGFITVEILKVFGLMTLKVADIRAGTRLRAVVQAILYEKILRTQSIGNENSGKIISLFANDAARLAFLIFFVASLIAGCVAFVVLAVYSVIYLGPWSLLGIIVFLSNVPIQIGLGKVMATFRMRAITVTDSRVRLISELLKSIRLVKMYAWETSFIQKLNDLRTREIHWIALSMVFYLFGLALGPLLPMFSTGVIFLVKIWTNFPLSAPEAFSILSAIVSMRGAMAELPYSMKILAELTVSLKRFKALMALPDTKQNKRQPNNPECDIEINNATFQWPSMCDATDEELPEIISMKKQNGDKNCHDDERTKIKHDVKDQPVSSAAILSDINLAINKGSLTGICGPIGSGKSTLLYSIMYRTEVVSGELFCNESVTYVPQQPWIMNTTMRENVTFGLPYNKLWYDQVIDACALLQDIEAMPNGDRTEIGERGVTLSGGQKVRLCLARAVYSNKDIYLLDDCLSAVDVRVGQHIFRECIQNILGNKTVVFVTHQLQYLKDTGRILVMDHGRIIEQGSHSQLIESDSTYSNLFRMYCNETTSEKDNNSHKDENTGEQEKETSREENHNDTSDKLDNLMVDEERGVGRVSWSAYRLYINKAGGICLAIILIMIFLLHSCNLVFTSWWLSYWINQGDGQNPIQHANITFEYVGSVANTTFTLSGKEGNILENPKLNFYMGTYGVAVLATLLIAIIKTVIFIKVSCRAATNLHSSMLTKVMFSPMSFFDTNPTGRILNRFSTDVDEVDNQIPKLKFDILDTLFHGFVYLVMICVVIPWALIGIVPTITILWVITMMGGSAVRELKRCENLRRSPLFAHLSNTIQGLQEVQTYGKEEMFKSKFSKMLDDHTLSVLLVRLGAVWVTCRGRVLLSSLSIITALLVTFTPMPVTFGGLVFAMIFSLNTGFVYAVTSVVDLEAFYIAIERFEYYICHLVSEQNIFRKETQVQPEKNWPSCGKIKFDSVSLKYRPGLPDVLKNISFDILSQEKIGIVGRTGAGKTSLGSALFRLADTGGSVYIDEIDIDKVDLLHLRSKISVIPQQPVLFTGTLRFNLDPFDEHSDEELWSALGQCHIKPLILSLHGQLAIEVLENGENFSVGERQLLCMARALLRGNKILLLDEATASIDNGTDKLIQQTIKEVFSHCTVLTIAHRIHTVKHYDRIMVIQNGEIVEFDSPDVLFEDPNSHLHKMINS